MRCMLAVRRLTVHWGALVNWPTEWPSLDPYPQLAVSDVCTEYR